MRLYGSPYDYVIHAGIIAAMRVPLITSFQPPLAWVVAKSLTTCQSDWLIKTIVIFTLFQRIYSIVLQISFIWFGYCGSGLSP